MGHLWLIGMMGAGKSVVGRIVAQRCGVPFYDLDETIEIETGMTIPELFDVHGERGFRAAETIAVRQIAAAPPGVVATGGGVVLKTDHVAAMRSSGTVVQLRATPTELASRLAESADRPLLVGPDRLKRIKKLIAARAPAYHEAADVTFDTDGLTPDDIARVIGELCTT